MIRKLRNNKFLSSTLLLLIGGVFGKVVGFILKIIVTRMLGSENMGVYSLLSPTASLLSTIAVFSYPNAISKVVSEGNDNDKVFFSVSIFSILFNLIIMFVVILSSSFISNYLLHESRLYYPIIVLAISLPFVSFSSIIKGFFWGKQNMFPYMLSNFIEQVTRLLLIVLFLEYFISIHLSSTISFILIVNIIGEIVSQFVMILFIKRRKFHFSFSFSHLKSVLSFSIPSTCSRLIGSFAYFLEPIVLNKSLIFMGYTSNYIIYEYGIINAYSLSLLLMPQFFIQNMSTSLIPELSKNYKNHNYSLCISRIKQIIFISVLIGVFSTLIICLFPKYFLNFIFHTYEGYHYIKILSPFVILFYIEYPLINALQAIGASKKAMKCSVIGSIVRLLSIALFSLLNFGMYSYILSIIINLIVCTLLYYLELKRILVHSHN